MIWLYQNVSLEGSWRITRFGNNGMRTWACPWNFILGEQIACLRSKLLSWLLLSRVKIAHYRASSSIFVNFCLVTAKLIFHCTCLPPFWSRVMVNISPLLARTVIVVTVSTLSISCPQFMPNPKQENIKSKRLCVSCLQCETRIIAYLVWGNESMWSPACAIRRWLYRQPLLYLGAASDRRTCWFFRTYYFQR